MCQDEALALSYPAIRERCHGYLKAAHPSGEEFFVSAREVCASMESACEFLRQFDAQSKALFLLLAQKALRGLASLSYHQSARFIQQCFRLCSCAARKFVDNIKLFTKLTLRLLAYPNNNVRKQVYEVLYEFCATFLNTDAAADPSRLAGLDALFLMSVEVLKEIVLYGLFQQETRIYAQNLLSLLTMKFLLGGQPVWDRLCTAIQPLFCGIFAHADFGTPSLPVCFQKLCLIVCRRFSKQCKANFCIKTELFFEVLCTHLFLPFGTIAIPSRNSQY